MCGLRGRRGGVGGEGHLRAGPQVVYRYCTSVYTRNIYNSIYSIYTVSITRLGGDNVASLEHTLTGHSLKV